jgi:hypothetical protein
MPLTNVPAPVVPNDSEQVEPLPTHNEDNVKHLAVSQLKDDELSLEAKASETKLCNMTVVSSDFVNCEVYTFECTFIFSKFLF